MHRASISVAVLLLAACVEPAEPDAGAVDAGAPDAGAVDAGAVDAGTVDAGAVDAGADAGPVDASPPPLLFAEVIYATRCEETLGCGGPQDRDVCGIDNGDSCTGVNGRAMISCEVSTDSLGARTLSFAASQGGGFAIEVAEARFGPGGGSAGGPDCRVTVTEGASTYEGVCGAALPSPSQPCQIRDVTFLNEDGSPTVSGAIFCMGLPNRANADLRIEVTNVGTGPEPRMTPGRFRIANCPGLDL